MNRNLLTIILFTFTLIVTAQEKLNYQLNEMNIEFTISTQEIYVELRPDKISSVQKIDTYENEKLSDNSFILKISDLEGNFQNRKQELKNRIPTDFQRIEPVLIFDDGTRQIANGELNLKIEGNNSINKILKGYEFTFQPNEFEKNLFLVKMELDTSQLFQLIKILMKDKRVEFVEPNFIRMIKPNTNDPFFSSQWSINNQGYLNGTIDADMDVDDAWALATGSGIKVAVIDTGVDLSHPDLQGNLLSGYDSTGDNTSGNQTGSAHGTACAGIIAAIANNNSGVAGVAYNAKILPVKIFPTIGSPSDNMIANGINWAWQNGADVLSNSYGGGSFSNTIANAVNSAVTNGRSGKGSVVLFSTGNDNVSVSFPANLTNAIAVGASSMCDMRKNFSSCDGETWWGSNFGTSLDVIAPGVKIYTTDISGSGGYNSSNYTSTFNGTSAACPNAAGVVALILSANTYLSQQEAREILERNVDKVGGYNYSTTFGQPNGTWNNEAGYGRINANNAVQEAVSENIQILGDEIICGSNVLTYNIYQANNNPALWSVSSNLVIVSSTSSSINVQPTSPSVSGAGYIEAVLPTKTVRKNIWVGKPSLISARLTDGSLISHYYPNNVCKSQNVGTNIVGGGYDSITWSLVNSSHTTTWTQNGNNINFYLWAINHTATFRLEMVNECGTSIKNYTFVAENCGGGGGGDPCDLSYSLSPNPASTQITITPYIPGPEPCGPTLINSTNDANSNAKVYDLSGNLLLSQTPGIGTIDVSGLNPGIYIIIITYADTTNNYQIIIE